MGHHKAKQNERDVHKYINNLFLMKKGFFYFFNF
jgi:hypothetical protein